MSTIALNAKDNASPTLEKVASQWRKMEGAGVSASGNISKGFNRTLNKMESDASSLVGSVNNVLAGLGAGLGAGALVGFLKDGIEKAREAEGVFSQLRFAVNAATDDGFNRYSAAVQAATAHTAKYAIVQEEVANKALQILVTNTGKLSGSMENLNLVFDLATAKHIDMESAAKIVSLAMEGNVIALRKQLPEFAELLDDLDKTATREDKAALAVKFLHDKLDGATAAMGEHQRSAKQLHKTWDDFWKGAGAKGLTLFDRTKTAIEGATRAVYEYSPAVVRFGEYVDKAALALQTKEARLKGTAVAAAKAALETAELAKKENDQTKAALELQAEMDHLNESIRMNAELSDFDTAATLRRKTAQDALTAALKEEDAILKSRQAMLASLDQEQQTAFLTRGSADDSLSRIRQTVFSGAGQSAESLQGLIKTTGGLTGGNEDDKARLLRDLRDEFRRVAGSDIAGVQEAQAARARGGNVSGGNTISFPNARGTLGNAQVITPSGGGATFTIPIYIGGEHLTTVTRKIDEQRRSDDALVGD